ncbi:hypothetical protein BDV97DRAFT_369863 [Delphinella strobiligena]|nr:hypothetical protein BDV97DRAFT_369863 [Delphinella strobiligena]
MEFNWGTDPSPAPETDWKTIGLGWTEHDPVQFPGPRIHVDHNNWASHNVVSLSHLNAANRVCREAAREKGYRTIVILSAIHDTTSYRRPDNNDAFERWHHILDPFGRHVTAKFEGDAFDEEPLEDLTLHVYVRFWNWMTGVLEHMPRHFPPDSPFEDVEYAWTSVGPPDKAEYARFGIDIDAFVDGYPNQSPELVAPVWRPVASQPIRTLSTPLTEDALVSARFTRVAWSQTQYILYWLDGDQDASELWSRAHTLDWDAGRLSFRTFFRISTLKRILSRCFTKQEKLRQSNAAQDSYTT